jgi:CMP/dCMP kinase
MSKHERAPIIAIDGPSGSGKSTLARGVARALGLRYLDTGAMYRALTFWMLEHGVDVNDATAVATRSNDAAIIPFTDPDSEGISIDGKMVIEEIRSAAVTQSVSAVSAVPAVRSRLVQLQRDLAASGGMVMEGRDIGSVVLPDADLKIFLTADSRVRAERRSDQNAEMANEGDVSKVLTDVHDNLADLARRDELDSSRAVSPLVQAPDAVAIDSTHAAPEVIVDEVLELLRERRS